MIKSVNDISLGLRMYGLFQGLFTRLQILIKYFCE